MNGSFHPAVTLSISVTTARRTDLINGALRVWRALAASRRPIPAIDTRPDLPEVGPVLAAALIGDLPLVEARDGLS